MERITLLMISDFGSEYLISSCASRPRGAGVRRWTDTIIFGRAMSIVLL